ncbi:hypothetical protein BV25DRAFT_1778302, partial [Artomyces pyxidatus]
KTKNGNRCSLTASPSAVSVELDVLGTSYGATSFRSALKTFIAQYCNPSWRQQHTASRASNQDIIIPFNKVDVWHKLSFSLKNLQLDDVPDSADRAHITPMDPNGLRVARLRVIFRVPKVMEQHVFGDGVSPPGHLAYMEWLSLQMFAITKSKRSDGSRQASIIEVRFIHRSCMLIPKFGARVDRSWTLENVLDRRDNFHLNN